MSVREIRSHPLFKKYSPSMLGVALFLVFVPTHLLVPKEVSVIIAALTLAMIGGAYIGFGASSGAMSVFSLELGNALLYTMVAFAGLMWSPLVLPLGLAAHAIWDVLHHNGAFGAPVPKWYIPFCVVFDLLAAVFLLFLYFL